MPPTDKAKSDGYMPMMTCPACGHDWQWDDYYDVKKGSERECPYCEATILVASAEHLLYCTFEVLGESTDAD